MRLRRLVLPLALVGALALAGTAEAASWKTIADKSGSGAFAVKSFTRTVNNPKGFRFIANSTKGMMVSWSIACSRNFTVWSRGGTWKPDAGRRVKRLPMMDNPDTCIVTAAFGSKTLTGGSWRLRLQKRL